MKTIDISSRETDLLETFEEGHSVQVRVVVSENETHEYDKGKTVKIIFNGKEAIAKIVSEPLQINPESDQGQKTLSLIVEKP
jgi:hypothetical protein